jgi:fructan beta-fructosidase
MKDFLSTVFLISLMAWWVAACSTGSENSETSENAYYSEPHRPAFHFSPDSMWMNDPNGLVYFEGEYHLFYQHYPEGNTWGPMHWGHAVSTDLMHWEHLPIALYPDSLGYIFSGSAVVDWPNSSGLGTAEHPPLITIFTHHHPDLEDTGSDQFQYQSIAYSTDRGRSWTKYHGNPVVSNPGIRDFRDPKVIRYEPDKCWIMTLAAADRVMFYSSPDLIHWDYESEFGEDLGAHGGVWECPDLFPLEINGTTKWVLLVSINPGGPNGGSATQYFIGTFDGKKFVNEVSCDPPLWIDYGKDNYAGVTWSDIPSSDGRRIFMGWMSNWQYANQVPTERWRNAMTLPRELSLFEEKGEYRLRSVPVGETVLLRNKEQPFEPGEVGGMVEIIAPQDTGGSLLEMEMVFEYPQDVISGHFGFILCNGQDSLTVSVLPGEKLVTVDRTVSGIDRFSPDFPGVHTAPLPAPESGKTRLHAFIDHSSLELFINEGRCVMTELFFPATPYDQVFLYSENGPVRLVEGTFHHLKNIWR